MEYLKQNHLSLLIIAFLILSHLFGGPSFGSTPVNLTTIGNPVTFSNTSANGGVNIASTTATQFKVGAQGTAKTRLAVGTCNIFSGPGITTIAATTTVALDCQATSGGASSTALAGVPAWAVGDAVFITQPTTTPNTNLGVRVVSATGSTTAGYITLVVANYTGATYTITSAATSSLQYSYWR